MIRNYKNLATITACLILSVILVLPASAQDSTTSSEKSIREQVKTRNDEAKTALDEFKAARSDQQLSKLKTYGDRAVSARTDAINRLLTKVSSGRCMKIDEAIKKEITDAIKKVNDNLSEQETAITQGTDLEATKGIVRKVFSENRVFAHIVPAANGACLSQHILNTLNTRIDGAVIKLKDAGLNTSRIEIKVAVAKTDAEAAYSLYLEILNNPGAEGNSDKFTQAKTKLQDVRKTLGDVKSDIANLMGDYKKAIGTDSAPEDAPDSTEE
jgi:hypothetical protein